MSAASRLLSLSEFARELLDHLKPVLRDKPGSGVDVVAGKHAVSMIVGQNDNGQVGLQEGLLINAPLNDVSLDPIDDLCALVDVTGHPVFLKREKRRIC